MWSSIDSLYIWLKNDIEQVVNMVSPFIVLFANTSSINNIFKLFALIERVKEYAQGAYWL